MSDDKVSNSINRDGILNRRVAHGGILASLVMASTVVALVLVIIVNAPEHTLDTWVALSFLAMGTLSLCALVRELLQFPFSLAMVHWFFYLIFFVIAPINQYLFGSSLWDFQLSESDYLRNNGLLLLWGLSFLFASCFCTRSQSFENDRMSWPAFSSFRFSKVAVYACVAMSAVSFFVLVYFVGFDGLLGNRASYEAAMGASSSGTALYLLQDKVLRGLPVAAFVVTLLRFRQSHNSWFALVLCAGLVLVTNFPFAMPRYYAAVVYGGLALLLFPPLSNNKGLFAFLFLFAFLIIFPMLGVFREGTLSSDLLLQSIGNAFGNIPQGFLTVDFDAYVMLARVSHYVDFSGPSWGYQLLGALLFFVPRSIWTSKPIGTGQTAALMMGQDVTSANVSCPLPGEFYANFGILGVLLGGVLLGILCSYLHRRYMQETNITVVIYPFLCMFLFFIMRGDLLSSLAYTIGFSVVFCLVVFIAVKLSGDREKHSGQRKASI